MAEMKGPSLTDALRDWGTEKFEGTLKRELENLAAKCLPLHEGLGAGGLIDDSHLAVTVISARETGQFIHAKVGVFFTEIVGGCSCGDDPFTRPACSYLLVTIDKLTAVAGFVGVDELSQVPA